MKIQVYCAELSKLSTTLNLEGVVESGEGKDDGEGSGGE